MNSLKPLPRLLIVPPFLDLGGEPRVNQGPIVVALGDFTGALALLNDGLHGGQSIDVIGAPKIVLHVLVSEVALAKKYQLDSC